MHHLSMRLVARILVPLVAAGALSVPLSATADPDTSGRAGAGSDRLGHAVSNSDTEEQERAKERKAKRKKAKAAKKAQKAAKERKRKKKAKKKARSLARRAYRVGAAQTGDPYRYGAAGPSAFDCSGLTSYAYRNAGKTIPRTSSAQRGATRHIAAGEAKVGDLVFFHGSGGVYHVGLYAGQGQILHAPYSGTSVRKERIWTSSVSYGRVR